MTVVRTLGIVGVLGALAGCTDSTGVGGAPGFVSLQSADAQLDIERQERFGAICDDLRYAAPPGWPRRSLDAIGATIALAPGMLDATAGFGDRPGFAARDGNAVLAVAYDDDLPVVSRGFQTAVTNARLRPQLTLGFGVRCTMHLNGRLVTVLGNERFAIDAANPREFRTEIGLPLTIFAVAPSGRRVNISVALLDRWQPRDDAAQAEIRLLAMAFSLLW